MHTVKALSLHRTHRPRAGDISGVTFPGDMSVRHAITAQEVMGDPICYPRMVHHDGGEGLSVEKQQG